MSSPRPAVEVDEQMVQRSSACVVVDQRDVSLTLSPSDDVATFALTIGRASHPNQFQSSDYLVLAPPGPSSVWMSGQKIKQARISLFAPPGGLLPVSPHPPPPPPRIGHVRDRPSAHSPHTTHTQSSYKSSDLVCCARAIGEFPRRPILKPKNKISCT